MRFFDRHTSAHMRPEDVDLWLVDGYNVLHACLLGPWRAASSPLLRDGLPGSPAIAGAKVRTPWWTSENQARVLRWISTFAQTERVIVVFDGGASSPRVHASGFGCCLVYAPDADKALLGRLRALRLGQRACIVSGDRSLRDRAVALGALATRPRPFADLIERRRADGGGASSAALLPSAE